MADLDIKGLSAREVNRLLREMIATEQEIVIRNPNSVHNLAAALIGKGRIVVEGSTGFYTGGFLEGPSLTVKGNTGWYTGDNMMAGEIIVEMNTGSNAAPSMIGGNLVIRGSSGSRCGFGMKGGNLIVCGDVGRWTGGMTLGGRIILLGRVGQGLGESMYKGVIHTVDPEVESKIGRATSLSSPFPTTRKEPWKTCLSSTASSKGWTTSGQSCPTPRVATPIICSSPPTNRRGERNERTGQKTRCR